MAKKQKKETRMIEVSTDILTVVERAEKEDWTFEQFVAAGQELRLLKDCSQWYLGKLATEVVDRFRDDEEFAKQVGISVSSLRTYRYVFTKFRKSNPDFRPDGYISWGAIQIAATTENPVETLNKLQDQDKTTMEAAYRLVKEDKTGNKVPPKPKLSVVWDDEAGAWKIRIRPEDISRIDWSDVAGQLSEYLIKQYA